MTAATASAVPPGLARWVTIILRYGVAASAVLLVVGFSLWAAQGGPSGVQGSGSIAVSDLPGAFASHAGEALILIGLLVLVATPLARVALSIAMFAAVHDRPFALFTFFVLAVLLLGVATGLRV